MVAANARGHVPAMQLAGLSLASIAGFATLFVVTRPATRDALDAVLNAPLCATIVSVGHAQDVTPLGSYALPMFQASA